MDTEIEEVKSKKIIYHKSSRFPSIELDYAVKVVTEARKAGKTITDTALAGKGSVNSGAYRRKKASLGYYGLINQKDRAILITPLAERIMYYSSLDDKKKALKEAFLKPELFSVLFNRFEKGVTLQIEVLGNILIREYGIQPTARSEFLSTFIKSGIYVDLITYNVDNKDEIILKNMDEVSESDEVYDDQKESLLLPLESNGNVDEYQSAELILSSGKAKIMVPKVMTRDDVKRLKAQILILGNMEE